MTTEPERTPGELHRRDQAREVSAILESRSGNSPETLELLTVARHEIRSGAVSAQTLERLRSALAARPTPPETTPHPEPAAAEPKESPWRRRRELIGLLLSLLAWLAISPDDVFALLASPLLQLTAVLALFNWAALTIARGLWRRHLREARRRGSPPCKLAALPLLPRPARRAQDCSSARHRRQRSVSQHEQGHSRSKDP